MRSKAVIRQVHIFPLAMAMLMIVGGCSCEGPGTTSPKDIERQKAAKLIQDADADVRALGMQALAGIGDRESIKMLIDGLEDEALSVRRQAHTALSDVLKRKIYFDPSAPAERRAREIESTRRTWQNLRERDLVGAVKERMPLAYFYDLNTSELFEDRAAPGPIETSSGDHAGMPAGVRAVVFACDDCGDDANRYVAWLKVPVGKLRQYGIPFNSVGAVAGEGAVAIRSPKGGDWSLRGTSAADRITAAVTGRCPQRPTPLLCRPGR